MKFNTITYTEKNQIVTITINRPKNLNALNAETIQELHDGFKQANEDENIRVIIVTGSG